MNYSAMNDQELTNTVAGAQWCIEEINNEWYKRHKINFPYRLCSNNMIYNSMSTEYLEDNECDKMILKQANNIREGIKND